MVLDLSSFQYLETNKTRHGGVRYYFRRSDVGRIRLPDPIVSPDLFKKLHAKCMENPRPIAVRLPHPTRKKKRHNPLYRAIWLAKARAKQKGRSFELTAGGLLEKLEAQEYRCAVTGIEFAVSGSDDYASSPYRPSIDRIDSTKGYTRDNCRVVILALNLALNEWGLETFMTIARKAISGTNCPT
ncbi:hypothetical protein CU102_12370 [Phyllobacterium brassicacearum]|uniref:Uncharacterized protein n=1 Tax=Phyllobacterium brassicacearum TaxID=314235 RepID=A0A2P7BQ37_9HYPH|nr:hypothetical protein [Phyllobacterium brassicacearum]PSH68552.1 hypothetical protein CU102_12370 [Phyllobacterium brassicacearum]TDQ19901.1 hypothetical protein DEV91_12496 [Phyllobacterium brassicacearum]